MNATGATQLLDSIQLREELVGAVDERTLQILETRRRTARVQRRGWLVRRMLLGADLLGLALAIILAEYLISRRENAGLLDARWEVVTFIGSLPGWVVIAKLYGLYERDEERTDHSTADDFGGVFHMVTVCTWLFWALTHLVGHAHPVWPKLLVFWAAAICFVTAGRTLARAISRRHVAYIQNAVIVGAGEVGQLIATKLLKHPEYGINLVGFIDSEPKERREDLGHLAILGGLDRVASVVELLDVERVIIAFSKESHQATLEIIQDLKGRDVQIDIVPRLFETVGPRAGMHMVEGLPLVSLPPARLSRSSALLKRALDLALSVAGLVVSLPLLTLIAIAIKLDTRGPAFYRHERVGRGGRSFNVLKFRTMRREACRGERYGGRDAEAAFEILMNDPARAREFQSTQKFAVDPRVTRVGRILRSLSLDELPQLVNVVLGDMSLVGPRAVTAAELVRYGDRVDELLGIRPGITGYWQINGRSRLSYDDRVRLDLSYIAGWSLGLDAIILSKTMRALFRRGEAV